MKETIRIRDLCVERIVQEFASGGMSITELDGQHFAGADIVLNKNYDVKLYRLTVIQQDQKKGLSKFIQKL